MAKSLAVHVPNGTHQLSEEVPGLGLGQFAPLKDSLQQVPTAAVIHEDANVRTKLEHRVDSHDVRMGQGGHRFDFPRQKLRVLHRALLPVDYLAGTPFGKLLLLL